MKYDNLYNVTWNEIKQVTIGYLTVLDKIKHKRPERVVLGLAVLTVFAARRFKLEPRRVMETAERVIRFAEDQIPHYPRAIEEWFKKELPND